MWYNAPYNAEIIKFIQSFSNPILDKFFVAVTMMGEELFFTVMLALIYWCINKDFGYRLAFAYLTNAMLNGGIKEIFKVPRPIGEPGINSMRLETAGGYSFPSGHSQSASSFWTSVMIQTKKVEIYILGIISILLVAISRLYLGVHRPVDVLAGMGIGALWVFVINVVFYYAEKTGKKSIFLLMIIPMIVLIITIKDANLAKVGGAAAAFYAGYIIEPRYIKFEVSAKLWVQIIKLIVGMSVALAIKELLKSAFPQSIYSDFFRYFLMGIWVAIVSPYLFKRFLPYKKK